MDALERAAQMEHMDRGFEAFFRVFQEDEGKDMTVFRTMLREAYDFGFLDGSIYRMTKVNNTLTNICDKARRKDTDA